MTELDTLKKRKEQLLLERDIAALERKSKQELLMSKWRWIWLAPLAILGLFWSILGIAMNLNDPAIAIVNVSIGAIFMCPLIAKALLGR